jgi:nicotinamide-nucleotide amidase
MFSEALRRRAEDLISHYRERGLMLATAESCTGGLVAALITSVAGSSAVFERGFVTYANSAKTESLGVAAILLAHHGAVSAEVAGAMAIGALAHSHADISLAVTGVAGPAGGSPEKPVGLVYLARANRNGEIAVVEKRFGDLGRAAIRFASVEAALDLLFDGPTGAAAKTQETAP